MAKRTHRSIKVATVEIYRGDGSIRVYVGVGETDARVFLEVGGPEIWWWPRKHVDPHNQVTRYGWLVVAIGFLPSI